MQIKCRFSSKILFEFETDSIKICLNKAIEAEANLRYADLRSADLRSAHNVAPTQLLLLNWGSVSDELCVELMRYDASNHSDRSKFDDWVKTDKCPYDNERFQRAANFSESKNLWKEHGYAQPKSAYELVIMLFKEKEIKFHDEEDSE